MPDQDDGPRLRLPDGFQIPGQRSSGSEVRSSRTAATTTLAGLGVAALVVWKFKAVILIALGKLKFILGGLKLLSIGQLFATFGTMLASIWVYADTLGFPFAVGLVVMIYVHELGHLYMATREGLPVGAPIFIPFIGAFIALRRQPTSRAQDALIGIGGPLFGTLGGVAVLLVALALGEGYWARLLTAVASVAFVLNTFNLFPVPPLDGGHIFGAVSPRLFVAGLVALAGLVLWRASFGRLDPVLPFFLVLGFVRGVGQWGAPGYHQVAAHTRFRFTLAYLGLVAFLTLMTGFTLV
ncbi:MAG: site-2 protease family protein [Candidatus Riflebacteria bacterium]|nr:site-2 protease family protein [Candidatus Riflebacteria bacterium]